MLNFVKEEKQRIKLRKKNGEDELEFVPSDWKIIVSDAQMKLDLDTVKSKIDYRSEKYAQHLELKRFRFGPGTAKEQKVYKSELKKLKQMRRGRKALISFVKSNNKRLMKIASLNPNSFNVKNEAQRERLCELHARILSYLNERNQVNLRLISLYSDENNKNGKLKKNTHRGRIARLRVKASRKNYRKLLCLYRETRSFRIPEAQKDRIYNIMNKLIDLRVLLTELKYRKRKEHPNARKARKALTRKIKNTKIRINQLDGDLDRFMRKASRRSRRTPKPWKQIFWSIVLLLIVGGAVLVFLNKDALISGIAYYWQLLVNNLAGLFIKQ
jgi:hypothetical protein